MKLILCVYVSYAQSRAKIRYEIGKLRQIFSQEVTAILSDREYHQGLKKFQLEGAANSSFNAAGGIYKNILQLIIAADNETWTNCVNKLNKMGVRPNGQCQPAGDQDIVLFYPEVIVAQNRLDKFVDVLAQETHGEPFHRGPNPFIELLRKCHSV